MAVIGLQGSSDIGREREINQDAFLIIDLSAEGGLSRESLYLLAVADGMGGHYGGEIASKTAINILNATFLEKIDSLAEPDFASDMVLELLKSSFQRANDTIYKASEHEDYHITMGSTLVAAFIGDKEILIANVGDSRAYLFKKDQLKQISQDHSLASMQTQKLEGKEQVLEKSLRNIITRAIGASPTLKVDTFVEPIKGEQFLLLCSDGLHGELSDEEIEKVFHQEDEPGIIVKKLIRLANQKGGSDNITAIVVRLAEDVVEKKKKARERGDHSIAYRKKGRRGLKIKLRISKIFNRKKRND